MKLDKRETATVLAALRMWQCVRFFNVECKRGLPEYIEGIVDIDDGKPPLDEYEIDALCERINFDE